MLLRELRNNQITTPSTKPNIQSNSRLLISKKPEPKKERACDTVPQRGDLSPSACRLTLALTLASRAECEDRLRAEFRIEMNAAVAESEQRWQNREQELQTQITELQDELSQEKSQVSSTSGRLSSLFFVFQPH